MSPDDGQQPALSEDLEQIRRKAVARHARGQAQTDPAPDQPLGPTWAWAAALLGQGVIAGLCASLVLLGPPWTCERAVGGGVLVLTGGPGLFLGVFAALVLEGLVVRVEELLEFRRFTERVAGVVTRAEFVEKQLSQGGYSRYAEFEVEYEASGRGRHVPCQCT